MAIKVQWLNSGKYIVPGLWTYLGKADNNVSDFTDMLNTFNASVKNVPVYSAAVVTFNWGLVETGAVSRYWAGLDALLDAAAAANKFIHLAVSYVNFNGNQVNPYVVPGDMWNNKSLYGGNAVGGAWWVAGSPTYTCVYNAAVRARFIAFHEELHDRYASHPAFGGTGTGESSYGTTDPAKTTANYNAFYMELVNLLGDIYTDHVCHANLNFGGGTLIDDALAVCVSKTLAVAWADTIPHRVWGSLAADETRLAALRGVIPIAGHIESPDYCDWSGTANTVTIPVTSAVSPGRVVVPRTGNYADGFTPLEMLHYCMHYMKNTVIPISRQTQNPTHDYSADIITAAATLAAMGESVYIPNLSPPNPPGFPGFFAGLVRESQNVFALDFGPNDYTEIEPVIKIASQAPDVPTQQIGIEVSGRFFKEKVSGKQIFLTGDTAWMLWKATVANRRTYLDDCVANEFTHINLNGLFDIGQGVTIDYNGNYAITGDSATPFTAGNAKLSDPFVATLDGIVQDAYDRGLFVYFVLMWGGDFFTLVTTTAIAAELGTWWANKYKNFPNVIFAGLGEYHESGSLSSTQEGLINAFMNAVKTAAPDNLRTIHPDGSRSSSDFTSFYNWLLFNSLQTYQVVSNTDTDMQTDFNKTPVIPCMDAEPAYEESTRESGAVTVDGYYVRYEAYHNVFQGAAGHTVGNDNVWQWINTPLSHLAQSGRLSMKYLRRLMESRPLGGSPNQSLIVSGVGTYATTNHPNNKLRALLGPGANYAFIYFPGGGLTRAINLSLLTGAGSVLNYGWLDPRDGTCRTDANIITTAPAGQKTKAASVNFTSPGSGSNDMVLWVEDPSLTVKVPGAL